MATAYRPPTDIGRDLARWLHDQGKTQSEVASLMNVTQPQLSRILSGIFDPGRSRSAQKFCALAGVPLKESRPLTDAQQNLYQVLNHVWDGSAEDAERLAALLRAAHHLRQPPSQHRQRSGDDV